MSGPGSDGRQPAQQQDDRQRARGDGERQPVGVRRDAEETAHLLDDRAALEGGPGHLAELADDHQYGAAGQVADEQRGGQELGDDPRPQQPSQQGPPRDDEREGGAQGDGAVRVLRGQRGDRHTGHQGDRGLGTGGQDARAAQHDIGDDRRKRRPQARHRRHVDDRRIGHHLRDQVCRHGHPRDAVRAEPPPRVPPGQVVQAGRETAQHPQDSDARASCRARSPGQGEGADARGWGHRPASRRAPASGLRRFFATARSLGVPHQLPPPAFTGVPRAFSSDRPIISAVNGWGHTLAPTSRGRTYTPKGQVGQTTWADRRGCHRPRSVSDNGRGRSPCGEVVVA